MVRERGFVQNWSGIPQMSPDWGRGESSTRRMEVFII
jgi:hypothetical protein